MKVVHTAGQSCKQSTQTGNILVGTQQEDWLGTNHPLLPISQTPDQQAPCVGPGPGMQERISRLSGLTGLGYLWEMAATVGEQESAGGGGRAVLATAGLQPWRLRADTPLHRAWRPEHRGHHLLLRERVPSGQLGEAQQVRGIAGSGGLPAPTETTPLPAGPGCQSLAGLAGCNFRVYFHPSYRRH